MRICIPVKETDGLSSRVAKKLKKAKAFAIIDIDDKNNVEDIRFIENDIDKEDIIPLLASYAIDIFIVNEIGKEDEEQILDMGIDLVKDAYGRIERILQQL